MIKLHPSQHLLEQHCLGQLPAAQSLVISAHVELCSHCQARQQLINKKIADQHLLSAEIETTSNVDSTTFDAMLEYIMQLPAAAQTIEPTNAGSIELDGRRFALPNTLAKFVRKTGAWSKLPGKLWQAPLDLGESGNGVFIFMEHGGRVPEHTHRGTEYTLVLEGTFSDGLADYADGDFMLLDHQQKHSPYSEDKDGCLVFSVVDKPLQFTSGLTRLLNPFGHMLMPKGLS